MLRTAYNLFKKNVWDGTLTLASWVIPKKKGLLVFTAKSGMGYDGNPKYLYDYFKDRKEAVWITRDEVLTSQLREKGINAHTLFSREAFMATLRAEFILIDTTVLGPFACQWLQFLGRFKIIQTWHGTGVKDHPIVRGMSKVTRFTSLLANSVVLASSEKHREAFTKLFMTERVAITGSPRNDLFIDPGHISIYSNHFGRFDRVYLYAPTWRDDHVFSPFTDDFLVRLDKWLRENNHILLIKRHPVCKAFHLGDSYSNILDVSDGVDDIQELLLSVDVLITDYSSIATDYALMDRPILFYLPDHTKFAKIHPLHFSLDTLPGPFAYDEETLLDLLKDLSWADSEDYLARYQDFKSYWHSHLDGRACERVEVLLEEI